MKVEAAKGEFRFTPSVENIPAGMLLEWFDGPQVCVAADSTLFWPYVDGIEVTDVSRRTSQYSPLSFRDRNWVGIYSLYPSYCQMQFLAAYKNGHGVYFSAVDDRHTLKQVDWERIGFATNWRREPSDLKITHADNQTETRHLAPLETIELQ